MATLIESTEWGLNSQMKNFANKIDNYATVLALPSAEILSVKADALALDFFLGLSSAAQSYAQNVTSFKNQLRKGTGQPLGALPVMPVFAAPPPMPLEGIEPRFRALVQRIKNNPAYNKAMGEDLGIEAGVKTFNAAAGKPVFTIEHSSGGHPNLHWIKGKFDGVEIWKDSGNGFVKLDRDMRPDYIDKSALPPAGVAVVWKYKMIYLKNDEPVGNWSDTASITVYGEV